jgi:muconolactone delta-isomerase
VKILALIDLAPGATPDKFAPLLKEEAARAWELYKEGVFREMNFRTDKPGVVNILECDSLDDARDVLNSLPMAKAGFFTFEVIPLGYASFLENLWADQT